MVGLDFGAYYCWAYALRTGLDPYTTDLVPLAKKFGVVTGAFHANYPATFILCFELLTLFPPRTAYLIWTGFNVLLLAAALAVLLARSGIGARECVAGGGRGAQLPARARERANRKAEGAAGRGGLAARGGGRAARVAG
jgi:hypothetical protein